ncbi:MAG: tetratricopeptide repeat protein [Woeseiaceae bacterium]|nr:tetratricopeptide repeat protein [Woeseiaceae bacterium]
MFKAEKKIGLLAALLLLAGCGDSDRLPAAPDSSVTETDRIPVTTTSFDARAAYEQAVELMDSLHANEARERLDEALSKDPDFALAHLLKARTAVSAEEFFTSLENAERVVDQVSLGEQLVIKAFRAATNGDADSQLAILRKLVALYPADETAHMRLGNHHLIEQQFELAVEHFGHAIELNTEYAPAYNMLGYAHRGLNDFDSARQAFKRYIELVPDEPNPYDSYAELLMEAGDYEESIANYRKSLEIDPDFYPSLAGIAINEALRGRPARAVELGRQMLEQSRNLHERQWATYRLVGAHLHNDDHEAALKAIDKLAEEGNIVEDALVVADAEELAADILLLQGDADAAMTLYESARKRRLASDLQPPVKAEARRLFLYRATLAALQSGWSMRAAEFVARYRSEASSGGNARERQRIHELEGYAALVQEDYEKAIDRLILANPLSPVVHYFTAVAYQGAGDLEAARKHAHIAAYRNTLSPSLPYFRKQALAMIEAIGEQEAAPE